MLERDVAKAAVAEKLRWIVISVISLSRRKLRWIVISLDRYLGG
jgi:hypothetical protein